MGPSFSPDKTVVVVLTHKQAGNTDFPELGLGGSGAALEYSSSVKYLGIILDHKLTFKEHVREKCKKSFPQAAHIQHFPGQALGPYG